MISRFKCTVGVSDHTEGYVVPTVSVALGAKIVEKHFILSRSLGGVDSAFSMEPKEFEFMVKSVRDAEQSLGIVDYSLSDKDKLRRRSLFAVEDIKKGEMLTSKNVRSIRPGNGLHPKHLMDILGKTAKEDIDKGTPLNEKLIK
jgi:pseudaminic acid synthase